MNSRRLMGYSRAEDHAGQGELYHIRGRGVCCASQQNQPVHVGSGSKLDEIRCPHHFRFASNNELIADIAARRIRAKLRRVSANNSSLFEHFIGTARQRQWDGNAKRFGRLQIDVHLDFSCLLHRQVSRLIAFENSANVDSGEAMRISDV
jgi:hypothetical protein